MELTLTVTAGPHSGQVFTFTAHDTFLVGRSPKVHFRLRPGEGEQKDRFVSRIHFMVEVNPPLCRVLDMNSRNGTFVNGKKVSRADLSHGDVIKVGHTRLEVALRGSRERESAELPVPPEALPVSAAPPPAAIPFAEPVAQSAAEPVNCLSCGAPLVTTGALCTPCREAFGRQAQPVPGYLVMRELGRGSLGVVHLALREADGNLVALKTISPAVAAKPREIDRFLREAGSLRQLQHEHIVAFREMGSADGLLYFAMEYVPGSDAARLLRDKGPLPVRTAVRLINQLLQALDYAHGRGFVHRDVKPANLLIADGPSGGPPGGGTVKVADFGLARVYQGSWISGLSMQDEKGGSVGYLAPEQIIHFREAKPPADQYSAAATLYTLLTGRQVYDFPAQVAGQIALLLNDDPVPISARRADLPPQLVGAIHKALSREPSARFPDVASFRRALAPFAG